MTFFIKNVFFHLILTLISPDNRLRQILSLSPHKKTKRLLFDSLLRFLSVRGYFN